jgi:hypothetical protein
MLTISRKGQRKKVKQKTFAEMLFSQFLGEKSVSRARWIKK